MFRRKWLASVVSVVMVFAFMPISSFALDDFGVQPAENTEVSVPDAEPAADSDTEATVEDEQAAEPAPVEETTEDVSEESEQQETESAEEVKDDSDDSAKMPAQEFSGTASNGIKVSVSAPEGAFPEGTEMKLKAVGHDRAVSLLEGEAEDVVDANGVDITFFKDGKEIQPQKAIKVSLSNANVEGETFNVYHVADNGAVDRVSGASSNGASFKASHFSIYIVSGEGGQNPETVTITYNFHKAAGSDELVDKQIVKNGETLVEPEAPPMNGHKFKGWTSKDGEITFGKQTITALEDRTVEAYPQYDKVNYVFFTFNEKVYYTAIGEYGDEETCIIGPDEFAAASNQTSSKLSDYAIEGWYTDAELKDRVSSVTLQGGDITLYGKGAAKSWVRFDSRGGSQVKSQAIVNGGKASEPAAPTKPGYGFGGWYSDKECSSAFDFSDTTINKDITLYAKWNAAEDTEYTVIYWQENADDDEYSYKESVTKTGETGTTASYDAKSYEGFRFDHADENVTIAGDGSTILNVYYKREVYKVTFGKKVISCGKEEHRHNRDCYSFGSYHVAAEGHAYGYSVEPVKTTDNGLQIYKGHLSGNYYVKIGNRYYKIENYNSSFDGSINCGKELHNHTNDCLKYEYEIEAKYGAYIGDQWPGGNWQKSNGNCQAYLEIMPLNGMAFGEKEDKNGSSSAYYRVQSIDDSNTYILHHTDTISGTGWRITEDDKYELRGFTFDRCDRNNGDRYNGATFYYKRNTYTIDFKSGGNTESVEYKYQADISVAGFTPTQKPAGKENYEFKGWCVDPQCTTLYDFTGKTMPANNMVLYAKWVPPTVNAIVYANVSEDPSEYQIEYGKSVKSNDACYSKLNEIKAKIESNKDNIWLGWKDADGHEFDLDQRIEDNVSIYPNYINSEDAITVTYSDGDEELAAGTTLPQDSKQYISGSKVKVAAGVKAKDTGKVFLGWEYGNTIYQPNDRFEVPDEVADNQIILVAKWGNKVAAASIIYYSNYPGSSIPTPSVQNLNNNEKTQICTIEACGFNAPTGYEFDGWATSSDGAVVYAAGESVLVDNLSANELYAKWKCKTFTVTWVDEDGKELEKDEKVPYGTMPSYDGETPTKAADAEFTYTFDGWTPGLSAVRGNVTYTATYSQTKNKYTVTYDLNGGTSSEKLVYENLEYGTATPKISNPTRAKTAEYTYKFAGWDPRVEDTVTGNATYKAKWEATKNKYTVTWKNEDGTVLEKDEDVTYGTMPSYDGETPTKAADAEYTYTFKEWTPEVSEVKEDAVYTATYEATAKPTTPPTPGTDPTPGDNGGNGGTTGGTPTATPAPATTAVAAAAPAPAADNTVQIEDQETPKANLDLEKDGAWALLNLLLSLLACIMSIALIITYFMKKREDEEEQNADYAASGDEEERKLKKKGLWRIISIAWAILMLIVFFLTEDMSLPMIWVDKWTILMVVMTIIQAGIMFMSRKKYEDEDEDNPQMA